MNAATEFVAAIERLESVAAVVWNASWQSAVLAGVVLVACGLFRERLAPRWRFLLWMTVFVRLALPALPPSPFSIYRAAPGWLQRSKKPAIEASPGTERSTVVSTPVDWNHDEASVSVLEDSAASMPVARAEPLAQVPTPASDSIEPIGLLSWLAALWAAGVAFLSVRLARAALRLRRASRAWIAPDDALAALFEECRRRAAPWSRARLRIADAPFGPATCGLVRPTVIVPRQILQMLTTAELRLVLIHELHHVRRLDIAWERAAEWLTAVHWFNPLAWLALSRLRREREFACDAAVLAQVGDAHRGAYGRLLLKIASLATAAFGPRPMPGIVGATSGAAALERRISMIALHRSSNRRYRVLGAATVVALAAVGLTGASQQKSDHAESPQGGAASNQKDVVVIAGECIDENRCPVAGAELEVHRVDSFSPRTFKKLENMTTGKEGRFAFPPLPNLEGENLYYLIVARREGLASVVVWPQSRGRDPKNLRLEMAKARIVSGQVVDVDGRPIAGALIESMSHGQSPVEGVWSTRSDELGQFALGDLPSLEPATHSEASPDGSRKDSYSPGLLLNVLHPDWAEAEFIFDRPRGELKLRLRPAGVIEGRVIDAVTGAPAAGAIIQAQGCYEQSPWAGVERRWSGYRIAVTDADGRYRLASLPACKCNLIASAADRICESFLEVDVQTGQTTQAADLMLVEGGWIEGTIVDATNNRPLVRDPDTGDRLYVQVLRRPPISRVRNEVPTPVDDRGRFRLRVAPGRNYPTVGLGPIGQRVERRRYFEETGIEVGANEVAAIEFRILPVPITEPPDPVVARLPLPVSEEQRTAAMIRESGGSYQVDVDRRITGVTFGRSFDAETTLQILKALPRLQSLQLHDGQATDELLREIATVESLHWFIASGDGFNDDGVIALASARNLTRLVLSSPTLTDSSLRAVSRLSNLTGLSLSGESFTDVGVRLLANNIQLRSLSLRAKDFRVADVGLEGIENLVSLEQLSLQGARLTDAGLARLGGLPKLTRLDVAGAIEKGSVGITDEGLIALAKCKSLKRLRLSDVHVTAAGIRRFVATADVEALEIWSSSLTRESAAEIGDEHSNVRAYANE